MRIEAVRDVSILGTRYSVIYRKEWEDPLLKDGTGYCDWTSKTIVIADGFADDGRLLDHPSCITHEAVRHELVHAFLLESGLSDYSHDEQIVEWIAVMLPRIVGACGELGALGVPTQYGHAPTETANVVP